ncbi:MAG TPA: hypothetical protein ENK16_04420 [Chromatiales bacterium]|nr:hypothetical protein [Chromatiales bacterium]
MAGVPDRVLDTLVDNVTICAALEDLDAVVDRLRAYERAGLGAIALRLYADPADSIRLIGERVVPHLSAGD